MASSSSIGHSVSRSYDDPSLSGNASGLGDFGADLLWKNVDGVDLGSEDAVADDGGNHRGPRLPASSRRRLSVTVEHEFRKNVLADASFTYTHQDYQNLGRVDDIYGFNIEGKYLLTRNLVTSLNVGYTSKVSNALGDSELSPYNQAIVALRLRLQY